MSNRMADIIITTTSPARRHFIPWFLRHDDDDVDQYNIPIGYLHRYTILPGWRWVVIKIICVAGKTHPSRTTARRERVSTRNMAGNRWSSAPCHENRSSLWIPLCDFLIFRHHGHSRLVAGGYCPDWVWWLNAGAGAFLGGDSFSIILIMMLSAVFVDCWSSSSSSIGSGDVTTLGHTSITFLSRFLLSLSPSQ